MKKWVLSNWKWGVAVLVFAVILLGVLLRQSGVIAMPFFKTEKNIRPEMLFLDETPIEVIFEAKRIFPEYKVRKEKERHLAKFLEGTDIVLAYDVQAKPLLGNGIYFYPLFKDAVVISVDKKWATEEIKGWRQLEKSSQHVNMTEKEPLQRYVWMAISQGLEGRLDKDTAQEYLNTIYQEGRLFWNNWIAPVQITFYSHYIYTGWQNRKRDIVFPEEGSLSFQLGLLSHKPLPEERVQELKKIYEKIGNLPLEGKQIRDLTTDKRMIPAMTKYQEFIDFGSIEINLIRQIRQMKKYAPINGKEHHIVALCLIILITLGISRVYKTVTHLGVRKGMIFTGLILMGWITVGVFKYSFYGSPFYIRGLWYSYYLFILMLPPVAFYIAVNINQWDRSIFPKWLKGAWAVSVVLTIMVLTNDFHRLVFRFLITDSNLWHKFYSYNIGYYAVAFWMGIAQIGAWLYLVRKSWDAPKKIRSVLPIIVLILGLTYSTMYNLRVPFFRDISLALGMSSVVFLFWASILKSGLIPANYSYHELFENSRLQMQIRDTNGVLCYQTEISDEDLKERIATGQSIYAKEEDILVWSTDICGGTIVTREDIRELRQSKRNLENVTKKLEEENLILSEKEQVNSRLLLLKEQNELTQEVNLLVEDKIKKMQEFLQQTREMPEQTEKGLMQLQRLAIYCKRRCELLIKSKQQAWCESQDIERLMAEVNAIFSGGYSFFCELEPGLPFPITVEIYECYHLFCQLASEHGIDGMTARLLEENKELYLYFLAEGDGERLWKEFEQKLSASEVVSYKNMGDAFSITLYLRESEIYGY